VTIRERDAAAPANPLTWGIRDRRALLAALDELIGSVEDHIHDLRSTPAFHARLEVALHIARKAADG
jgi:hypothetical protein